MMIKIPEVGRVYAVFLEDCCVSGEFTSRLVNIEYDENDYMSLAEFENGVRLYNDHWTDGPREWTEVQDNG